MVFGRSGSRQSAFLHLTRQLGVPIDLGLVRDRLAIPPIGPMSDIDNYDSLALRLDMGHGFRWLTVRDKFAPYGYVPAEQRGQPCVMLVPGTPRDTVTSPGAIDGLTFEGRADLREDGSASVDLAQSFSGNLGIQIRGVLDKIAEGQLHDSRRVPAPSGETSPGRACAAERSTAREEPRRAAGHPARTSRVPRLARSQGGSSVLSARSFPFTSRA